MIGINHHNRRLPLNQNVFFKMIEKIKEISSLLYTFLMPNSR